MKEPNSLRLRVGFLNCIFIWVSLTLSPYASLGQDSKPVDAESKSGIDWILVIDTSLSMEGKAPGARRIFPQVKESINKVIGSVRTGDTVTLYSFDSKVVTLQDKQTISNDTDKENLKRIIGIIEAKGSYTHTGEAVKQALEQKDILRSQQDLTNRAVIVALFTDGQEDVRDMGRNPFRLSDIPVSLISKGDPYVYLVWLGSEQIDEELNKFLNRVDPSRRRVITANTDEEIGKIDNEIRQTAPVPVQHLEIKFSTDEQYIDFGEIEPGDTTSAKTILLNSNQDARGIVSIDGSDERHISLADPAASIELKAGENKIKVRLKAPSNAPNSEETVRLVIAPQATGPDVTPIPATVNAHLRVYDVPFLSTLSRLSGWLLLVAFLALLGLTLYKRQSPQTIWRDFRDRNHLEGELEIIRPRTNLPDGDAILLQQYRTERLRLGQLLPAEAIDDSDAELVTVSKKGRKLVQLRHIQGSVRVNNIDVGSLEIYDSDVIDIGNARLRFNSTLERPPEEITED